MPVIHRPSLTCRQGAPGILGPGVLPRRETDYLTLVMDHEVPWPTVDVVRKVIILGGGDGLLYDVSLIR